MDSASAPTLSTCDQPWLALVIGNTRLHWAGFQQQRWLGTWHTPHLNHYQVATLAQQAFAASHWQGLANLADLCLPHPVPAELWVASVVAAQEVLWQPYSWAYHVQREQMPIANLYGTLGIDRALALLGAGDNYGWPVLVIDAGTALTLTAGGPQPDGTSMVGTFIGGAILPGLSLQALALATQTDALPQINLPDGLPTRWAQTTPAAIQSGIIYTVLGGLRTFLAAWWDQFPEGQVVITGGDGPRLQTYLNHIDPDTTADIEVDENLVFWGLRAYRRQLTGR